MLAFKSGANTSAFNFLVRDAGSWHFPGCHVKNNRASAGVDLPRPGWSIRILLRAGFRVFYVLVSLLLSLFGFSLNTCTRIERLDSLPEAHRLRRRSGSSIWRNAQHLVFQGRNSAVDIEILGHVGSSDALTEILEALASRRSTHSSKLRDLVCQFRVVRELLGHAPLTTLGGTGRVTGGMTHARAHAMAVLCESRRAEKQGNGNC